MRPRNVSAIIKKETGFAVIYLAIIIFVLVAMVGLAVDVGYMYVVKAETQNAADAGALAGVAYLRPTFSSISSAKNAAKKFAETNSAAGQSLLTGVSLDKSVNDITDTNDITVGYWDGTAYHDGPSYITGSPPNRLNAVKVRVRRSSGSTLGPVNLFFTRLFGWNTMGTGADAIADLVPAKLLPIMVNEYWLANVPPGQKPYGSDQSYPNSFVRATNVDGTPSKVFGKIFGLMGANASDNVPGGSGGGGSQNVNGYVYLDVRNSNHQPSSGIWYTLNAGASTTPDCASCSSNFSPSNPTQGDIDSAKYGPSIGYLLNGYQFIPPATVTEPARIPYANYPNLNVYPSPTSSCPYATIAFFSASGRSALNQAGSTGQYFNSVYPPGTKIITLVYDGTFVPDSPKALTAVGYTLLQIDGYASTNPKNLDLGTSTPQLNGTEDHSNDQNTVYGHAIADIVTPGDCASDIINAIINLEYLGGTPKLVK